MTDEFDPRLINPWPASDWSPVPPRVSDHPDGGSELVWAVRGRAFNRPALARTNVGARKTLTGAERYVVTQIMCDGLHGMILRPDSPHLQGLEWLGPIIMPPITGPARGPDTEPRTPWGCEACGWGKVWGCWKCGSL